MANGTVRVSHLSHSYRQRLALDKVSFQVQPNEIFGFLGPNGSGKTTLFKVLSTTLVPSSGQVFVSDLDVSTHQAEVRKRIGVVFQSPGLDRKLTVYENLLHQGHLYGLRGGMLKDRINTVIERVKVADRLHHLVETLSGGLQRRVELAKAFLHQPELLLLDEPTHGLDPSVRQDLWTYLQEMRSNDGVTILLTTHMMDDAEHCDRLAILDQGILVACGAPAELKGEVGGDVIIVETRQPEELRKKIEKRFHSKVTVFNEMVRFERANGHRFLARLIEAFPGQIESVSLRKPTLEDVFIRKTGHRLIDE